MTYKIAIIGHGSAGDLHRSVIEENIPDLEVIAVVDPRFQEPSKMSFPLPQPKKYTQYLTLDDLLASNVSFNTAIIATPTDHHLDDVRRLTYAGKNLLIEKPLGQTYTEAEMIEKYISNSGVKSMACLTGRFHPEFMAAYRALQEGLIGNLVSMQERIHFGFTGQFLRTYLAEHGNRGVAMEDGIHTFDRINLFSGSKIVRIDGLYKSNGHFGELAEDYAIGIAVTESGLHTPFSQRFTQDEEEDYVFQVTGTEGSIKVEGFKRCILTQRNKKTTLFEHDLTKDFRDRHKPGYKNELDHFVRYLNGETNQNYLSEALEAQMAVELQYQ